MKKRTKKNLKIDNIVVIWLAIEISTHATHIKYLFLYSKTSHIHDVSYIQLSTELNTRPNMNTQQEAKKQNGIKQCKATINTQLPKHLSY